MGFWALNGITFVFGHSSCVLVGFAVFRKVIDKDEIPNMMFQKKTSLVSVCLVSIENP